MIQVATDGYRFHFYSKSTSLRPTQKVRVPKLQAGSPWKPMEAPYVGCHCPCTCQQVDPQGGVTYQDETVERDGKPEEQGQSWQEAWMPWAVASVAFWPRN